MSKLTRRAFVGSSIAGAPAVLSAAEKRRNVLFISSDDLCNRIACYGDPVIKTPNIDRLAKSGVRFDRAYCQFPLCCPSRTSLMTGLAPDTTRVWGNNVHFRTTVPDAVTISQLFTKNGYFAARAGKIYHYNNPSEIGTPGFDDAASWQETANPAGLDRTRDEAGVTFITTNQGAGGGRGASAGGGRGASGGGRGGSGGRGGIAGGRGASGPRIAQDGKTPVLPMANGDLGVAIAYNKSDPPEQETDALVVDAIIAMMEKHRNEPWFLAPGFFKPHVAWIVPSRFFDMYKLEDMQVPPFNPDELQIAPHWAYTMTNANYGMNTRQHQEAMRAYYAALSFMDSQVGRLLDAVEKMGLKNSTTSVMWSDHGWQLGEHGQWQKQTLFEPSARVPLIIAGAGVKAAGKACQRTVEHLDIYPTLVSMCGLKDAPSNLQGRNLTPLLSNPNAKWDHPAVSQVSRNTVMGYSLRTERYRYTFWAEGKEGEELYDYQTDPRELRNLATDQPSAALKASLRAKLEQVCAARGIANARSAVTGGRGAA